MHALTLLRPADVDLTHGQLFRPSALAVAAIAIVMGAIVVACIWIGWRGGIVFGGHRLAAQAQREPREDETCQG